MKGSKERVNKTITVATYCPLEWVHRTAEPVTRAKFGGRGRVPILLEYGSEVKFDSIFHASRRTKLVTAADLVTAAGLVTAADLVTTADVVTSVCSRHF